MRLMGAAGNAGLTDALSAPQQNGSDVLGDSASLEHNFLMMLTAELKNQDPMNPMDSTQMVTQLSQISTSQGITNLEKLSESQIMAAMGSERLASSQLIGKSIDYRMDQLTTDGVQSDFSGKGQSSPGTSGDMTITITDQNNNTVRTLTVPAGQDGGYRWNWDGKNDQGEMAAKGAYHITGTVGGRPAEILQQNTVREVNFMPNGETRLMFDDGKYADIQDVTTIGS